MVIHGYYKYVKEVVDMYDYYYMVTERLYCDQCKFSPAGWHDDVMESLPYSLSVQCAVAQTKNHGIDIGCATMMRKGTSINY